MEAEYRSMVKQLIEELGKKDHFLAIWTKGSFKKRKKQNKTNCVRVYKMRCYLVRDATLPPTVAIHSLLLNKISWTKYDTPQIHDTPKGRRDQVSIQVDTRLNRVGSWRLGYSWYLSDLICEWSLLTLSRKKSINKWPLQHFCKLLSAAVLVDYASWQPLSSHGRWEWKCFSRVNFTMKTAQVDLEILFFKDSFVSPPMSPSSYRELKGFCSLLCSVY